MVINLSYQFLLSFRCLSVQLSATTHHVLIRCTLLSFRPSFLFRFETQSGRHPRSSSGNAVKHAFGADILIDVWPMDAMTVSDDFPVCPLFERCLGQPPRPGQRHADCAPIHELSRNGIFGDSYVFNSHFLYLYRNVHLMPALALGFC